jgi:hypothetical protein
MVSMEGEPPLCVPGSPYLRGGASEEPGGCHHGEKMEEKQFLQWGRGVVVCFISYF